MAGANKPKPAPLSRIVIGSSQSKPPGVSITGFRQLAPIHDAGEKSHVIVVNLSGQRILGCRVGEDLFAELAKSPNQLVAEPLDLDTFVIAQQLERVDVLSIE